MSSVNLGFGACPFGSSPFGFGSPAQVNSSTAALLRKPDGTYGDCVAIDPKTGDYILDENGNKVGGDSLQQMVWLALRTIKGSSAVLDTGIGEFPKVVTDDISERIRALVLDALSKLTTAGLIEVTAVLVSRVKTSAVGIEVRWKDITTGVIQQTFV